MPTLTISTTGIAPNAAGNPAECHTAELDLRRYFGPDAEVAIVRMDASQAVGIAVDLLHQLIDADVLAGWNLKYREPRDVVA